ncbi:hypothetical protein E4U13_006093 [Claviceps humidiphila]|uniref:Cytidine deaminase n=1 Tax=Claviceps humidiphila TaxID=1294629 RepID=A0A9P7TQS8_9HYPO|nr:hypothetical protein E4U13_006093 [Claviceps humidiphila]
MSSHVLPPLSPEQITTLRHAAFAAKDTAYCPYSNFRVGAALLLCPFPSADSSNPVIITGANVENAAYPVGTCAERVALGKAVTGEKEVSDLVKSGGVRALGVATDVTPAASPCGMCRQFIREFCKLSMPIYMFDKDGNYVVKTLEELLPMSFGPEDLVMKE